MKILKTKDVIHTVELIPRIYVSTSILDFIIYDECERVEQIVSSSNFNILNGIFKWNFEFSEFNNLIFSENSTYKLTIKDNELVIYRGKFFVTSQKTQNFKLTEGLYAYN